MATLVEWAAWAACNDGAGGFKNGALVLTEHGFASRWTGCQVDKVLESCLLKESFTACIPLLYPHEVITNALRRACNYASLDAALGTGGLVGLDADVIREYLRAFRFDYIKSNELLPARLRLLPVCDNAHFRCVVVDMHSKSIVFIDTLHGEYGWRSGPPGDMVDAFRLFSDKFELGINMEVLSQPWPSSLHPPTQLGCCMFATPSSPPALCPFRLESVRGV
jgi:hypothetical protein